MTRPVSTSRRSRRRWSDASRMPWASRATASTPSPSSCSSTRWCRATTPRSPSPSRDAGTVEVTVHPCAALEDRDTPSPLDGFDDAEPGVFSAIALAVNPRAQIDRHGERSWRITIDPDAEPAPEHPLAELVGGHNYLGADMRPRSVPVAIT